MKTHGMAPSRWINLVHPHFGDDAPALDLDFQAIEYNHRRPVALIEYQTHLKRDANADAFVTLANYARLPAFVVVYRPALAEPESVRLARRELQEKTQAWVNNSMHASRWDVHSGNFVARAVMQDEYGQPDFLNMPFERMVRFHEVVRQIDKTDPRHRTACPDCGRNLDMR